MKRFVVGVAAVVAFAGNTIAQLTESNLPIIVIESIDDINSVSRVEATMKIYYKEDGSINRLTDTPENYDGNIGIKFRGQSSLWVYEKKGYSVETRDAFGEDETVNLLGMPKESDWVLHGPYGDKSLMRNALMYSLADQITPYAPRVQMVEVMVNDDYRGVYLFTEKIKRDDSRVDIANLKSDDIDGDELTGGYILKFDKSDDDEIGWNSSISAPGVDAPAFVHVDPDADDITIEQSTYIKNWMDNFEALLNSDEYTNEETGYRKKINTESFIDFMLLNEMSRNVDGYRLSTYMYKDKDSNDDELHMGPVWDYNLAFGNADYCNGSDIEGWAYDFNDVCPDDLYSVHFWWKRLLTDPTFQDDLKEKWMKLRNGKFSNANITELIDGFEAQLQEPAVRNFEKFPILGEYVWPNEFVGDTYLSEVDYLRQWLSDRLQWMDQAFGIELSTDNGELVSLAISPNPVTDYLTIDFPSNVQQLDVVITSPTGAKVLQHTIRQGDQINVESLPKGIYDITAMSSDAVFQSRFVRL